jgi:hypothetical protein
LEAADPDLPDEGKDALRELEKCNILCEGDISCLVDFPVNQQDALPSF